jgi:hypothetical protein
MEVVDINQLLVDQQFWTRVEYAASRLLQNSEDKGIRRYWIDGFIPESGKTTRRGTNVEGIAWVGEGGRKQNPYRFVALLSQKMLLTREKNFQIEECKLDEGLQILSLVIGSLDDRETAGI